MNIDYSMLKYLWFDITYTYLSLLDINIFCDLDIRYGKNRKKPGGCLLSLLSYGIEDQIFNRRKLLICMHIDSIVTDFRFEHYIKNHIFGKCLKSYRIKEEQEMSDIINNYKQCKNVDLSNV